MNKLVLTLAIVLLAPATLAAEPTLLIERLERDLGRDKALSVDERAAYLAAFRQELGSYAFDVLKGGKDKGASVVMRIVMEGSFGGVDVERTVGIASAAYVAISRGAPPDLVEGVALYGFTRKLSADKIAAWANGANDCLRFSVPLDVARDLVYNAVVNDWDIETFNRLKWGLVRAAKAGHDMNDFAAHLFGNFLKGKTGPGATVGDSLRAFQRAAGTGAKPHLPKYESPVLSPKPAPKPKPIPPSTPRPEPVPEPGPTNSRARILSSLDASIRSFLGTPYAWGGRTRRGTDCSGFVQSVFAEAGIDLPRSASLQWKVGEKVALDDLKKGDLVFFRTYAPKISHVGIVTDPRKSEFVHASSSRGVVRSNLKSRYYRQRYAGARRVIP